MECRDFRRAGKIFEHSKGESSLETDGIIIPLCYRGLKP